MYANKNGHYKQGYYQLKHPDKYVGDPNKVRFMSSWELQLHRFLDNNTRVLRWASEEICIPYVKPTDGKVHRYYPDYWVEYVNADGEVIQEVLEVKPAQQTRMPKSTSKHRLYEQLTYAVNQAKWDACQRWCDTRGIKFRIVTENSIFK